MLRLIRFSISAVSAIGFIMVGCANDDSIGSTAAGGTRGGSVITPNNTGSTTNTGTSTGTSVGTSTTPNTGPTANTTPSTPICGNSVKEGIEECDRNELGGETCASVGAGVSGKLSCNDDCTINDSMCVTETGVDSGYGGDTVTGDI
jgi:hypothetical protein